MVLLGVYGFSSRRELWSEKRLYEELYVYERYEMIHVSMSYRRVETKRSRDTRIQTLHEDGALCT